MASFFRDPLYRPFSRALLRIPLLPAEFYQKLDSASLAAHLQNPWLRTAILLASPSLMAAYERTTDKPRRRAGTENKIRRYLARACSRPTPFGLFAGVAMVHLADATDLALASTAPALHARPDMEWLLKLILELEKQPSVRRNLRVVANASAFVHGSRVILTERAFGGGDTAGTRVSIKATGVVQRILSLTSKPICYADLVNQLVQDYSKDRLGRIEALLDELFDQTILLTELRPPLTDDPLRHVITVLAADPAQADLRRFLIQLQDQCKALGPDSTTLDHTYREVIAAAEAIGSSQSDHVLQVDTTRALAGQSLSKRVGIEAARLAEILMRLSPWSEGVEHLETYYHSFVSRYGDAQEVPLLALMDPHVGLGPPAHYADPDAPGGSHEVVFARRAQTLMALATEALRDRKTVISIDEQTLSALETGRPRGIRFPHSLDVSLFIAAANRQAIDDGEFKIIIAPNVGGSTAGKNLGRFAGLLGGDAANLLTEIGLAERAAEPAKIWAELVYLPRDLRNANIALRPHVREFEIAVGTSAGRANVIPLSELVIGAHRGRLYARWTRANKLVALSSTHMLNDRHAPAVCRFLSDLQHDGQPQLSNFHWGPAAELPYLPRLEFERIVLCPARWRIDAVTIERELKAATMGEFVTKLRAWRDRWMVPRHVHLSMFDNRLALDLEQTEFIEDLWRETRGLQGSRSIIVQEMLPDFREAWLPGPDGHYLSELVVSVCRTDRDDVSVEQPDAVARRAAAPPSARANGRIFPPGSEWLYLKLYCTQDLQNTVLAQAIGDFIRSDAASAAHASFFFVRYFDPDAHLRIRLRGTPDYLHEALQPALCKLGAALLSQDLCSRFSFDTYERETARYGGDDGIELAETIFAADSRMIVELFRVLEGDRKQVPRDLLHVASLHRFLRALDLQEIAHRLWKERYGEARQRTGPQYRARKSDVLAAVNGAERWTPLQPVFERALVEFRPLGQKLAELDRNGRLTRPIADILDALIHMHCNRMGLLDRDLETTALGLMSRAYDALQLR